MVRQLHDGMTARVTDNGTVSEAFAVTNRVKLGCLMAPTLFSLRFLAMLINAYRDDRLWIRIAYRTADRNTRVYDYSPGLSLRGQLRL
ncbi:unnamed protein product [Schistocephalus solidus]|uniref:Reverse transcriptase domain-containing protein n=1 Tax=Schistocephalus solidus TaxID=70667 RepID=A0A183TR18_SCHSO|nr:unnamed protein product [Schistocephalus solidus]